MRVSTWYVLTWGASCNGQIFEVRACAICLGWNYGPVVCVRRDVRDPCWVEDNILQQYMWTYDQYSSQAYYFGSGNLEIMGGYACRYAHIYMYMHKDR